MFVSLRSVRGEDLLQLRSALGTTRSTSESGHGIFHFDFAASARVFQTYTSLMLRWAFLILALVFLAVSSLTVVRAPAWSPWQLAVLAGEYGHLLALAVVGVGALVWGLRGTHVGMAGISLGLLAIAAGLYLKPAFQAWRIGAALPEKLHARFGDVSLSQPAFSFRALLDRDPPPVAVRNLSVAPGLPFDFYEPVQERVGPAPCVIVVHGGGWNTGDRRQLSHFNHWLAQRGFAVVAVSYRLAPQAIWPAQREDVLAAIEYVKQHFAELGVDPNRLVLLGRSAGGQIAQAVGYTQPDPAIRGVIGLYSPADLIFGYAHADEDDMLKSPQLMRDFLGGTPETARANYESASAHLHVNARTPPSLLVHGENDALVWHRHSVRLEASLSEFKVPHVFVSLPWATHGFDFNLHGPGGQLTRFSVEWFLRSVTR